MERHSNFHGSHARSEMTRIARQIGDYAPSELFTHLWKRLLWQFSQIRRKFNLLQKRTVSRRIGFILRHEVIFGIFAHFLFFLSISGATYFRHSGTKMMIPEATIRKTVRSVKPPPTTMTRQSQSHTSKSTDNPIILIGFMVKMIDKHDFCSVCIYLSTAKLVIFRRKAK